MELKFEVQLKIRKPLAQVFEAVVDPGTLAVYFVPRARGPLAAGKTVRWKFPEFDGEFDVVVREVSPGERIVFEWEASERGYDTRVEMLFKALDAGSTMVQIRESGWKENEKGLESSYGNCGGWMHMACCLKAFIEHGINLRAGGVV
jgi:uncharacterized protein YndB with AHSA1/START domain